MLVVFAALVLAGATTSSIGIPFLSQDGAASNRIQLGDSQWIRSDEYNVGSPIALSIMQTGGSPTLSPLGAAADLAHRYSSGGFFETVVFFNSEILHLGQILPQSVVFSAYWWTPVVFLFFFLPRWFGQVTGVRRLGWLAALLIFLGPCVAWWTMVPIQCLAFTVAGSSLLISAFRRFQHGQRYRPVALSVAAGILLAGLPTQYAPWTIILGVPVLVATIVWILTRSASWPVRIWPIVGVGLISLVLAGGTFIENSQSVQAMLNTVYPGARRSAGMAQPFEILFGAPGLGVLTKTNPVVSNSSEISTSFTVSFVWALALLLGARGFGRLRNHLVELVIGAFGALWLIWAAVNTGSLGARIPILNLIPPARAAQVVGILGIILVCLLLARRTLAGTLRTAILAAVLCGIVTATAVSLLQTNYLPGMSTLNVVLSSVGVALVVFVVTRNPRRVWAIGVASALAGLTVLGANPILFGLADFRDSDTAHALVQDGEQARKEGTLWASNSTAFDAVTLGAGVPSLSGFQRSGPAAREWEKLDPKHDFEDAWNRGGGYLPFSWVQGASTKIETNGFDQTYTRIDPCVLAHSFPNLRHIASTFKMQETCLAFDKQLEWSGAPMYIYNVK